MATLRKDNAILKETDPGKIKELEALGYEKVTEEDLKPKKKAPKKEEPKKEDKKEEPKKEDSDMNALH